MGHYVATTDQVLIFRGGLGQYRIFYMHACIHVYRERGGAREREIRMNTTLN